MNLPENRVPKRVVVWLAAGLCVFQLEAQDPLSKPITEADLLRTLESVSPGGAPGKSTGPKPGTGGDSKPESSPARVPADSPGRPGVRDSDAKRQKGSTEITSEAVSFDNKEHLAVFKGKVVVNDPEFRVACDKLTAFLKGKESDSEKPAADSAKAVGDKGEGRRGKESGGGLKQAVAEAIGSNRVRIIQEKKEADGKVTKNTGEGRKAVYDAETGNITLTGMPWVQTGVNMCIALEEETVMVLNRAGKMEVRGANKTVIKESAPEGGR
jgi:lipopolysaccharide export system protein LptA